MSPSSFERRVRRVLLLALSSPMILAPPLPAQQVPLEADRWNRAAMEWIGFLRDGRFADAGARVAPSVPAGAMSGEALERLWTQVAGQLGALVALEPGPVAEEGAFRVVDMPARFERQSLTVRVALDDSLRVGGFFLRPAAPPAYDPPDYVDTAAFREVDVEIGHAPWVVPGTLTLPEGDGPFPGVVLVHGSGPNDRDETLGGHRPFRDLAWGLASRGIAVLRYDKRTRVHGGRLPADIGLDEEVVDDAVAALDTLRGRAEVPDERVFVLGHSLGGLMAPAIAARDGALAGAIVLAGPARPFDDVLLEQLAYLRSLETDDASPAAATLDSALAATRRLAEGTIAADETLLGVPAAYWMELQAVDPVGAARELATPLLVLQGGRDYQVTEADLEVWRAGLAGREDVELKLYPSLNHLFHAGEGKATPAEYAGPAAHVAAEVVADVARWILDIGSGGG